MAYDLCIVGAGMFGSAAARHASANPALKVCLVGPSEPKVDERKNREIFSSHYDAGRITRIVDEDPACEVLSRESIKRYKELEKLSGMKFHTPVGLIHIVPKSGSDLKILLQSIDAKNVPTVELSRETFERRYPYLRLKEDETAILDDNGGGHINPRKMVEAQKIVAKLQGCDIIKSVVSGITLEKGYYQVKTETGDTITAKRLIVSTGVFVNTKTFDVLKPLKVTKMKETVTLYKVSEEEVKRLSSLPDVIYHGNPDETFSKPIHSYFLPPIKYPDGNYYVKAGMEGYSEEAFELDDIKNWYLSEGDKNLVDLETKLLKKIIPGIKYSNSKSVTCAYCNTPMGVPYIDRITPTLTVAIGGNGKSAKLSDEIGRLAAQLSVTGNWDSELGKTRFEAIFQE